MERNPKSKWLLIGLAALLGLTVILLLNLRKGGPPPRGEPAKAVRRPIRRDDDDRLVRRVIRALPSTSTSTEAPSAKSPASRPARRAIRASRSRRAAPPALPARIREETDPEKKAQLLRMHRLASARVRVSLLTRRKNLLGRTLSKARASGKDAERLRSLETQMRELEQAISDAHLTLERAKRASSDGEKTGK